MNKPTRTERDHRMSHETDADREQRRSALARVVEEMHAAAARLSTPGSVPAEIHAEAERLSAEAASLSRLRVSTA